MPRVKFTTTGHSHLVGNFSAGDVFTGCEAECRHFVEDAHCAVWDEGATAVDPVQASEQLVKRSSPQRTTRASKAAAAPASTSDIGGDAEAV